MISLQFTPRTTAAVSPCMNIQGTGCSCMGYSLHHSPSGCACSMSGVSTHRVRGAHSLHRAPCGPCLRFSERKAYSWQRRACTDGYVLESSQVMPIEYPPGPFVHSTMVALFAKPVVEHGRRQCGLPMHPPGRCAPTSPVAREGGTDERCTADTAPPGRRACPRCV